MSVLWSTFQSTVVPYLDAPIKKTESDTAKTIADAYGIAVKTAMITLIPGSTIISTPPTAGIEVGILSTLNQIKTSQGPPTPPMFTLWAAQTILFWQGVTWNPIPPPPGYVLPTLGVTVSSGGTPSPLDVGLWNAFNNPTSSNPMGNVICTKLISAFTSHLLTISGLYTGLIPSAPAPILGPPFPWIGVI